MPTASPKQAAKRAPAQPVNRQEREARRLRRATRRERVSTTEQDGSDILVDHDFHGAAEEIEIDPQLDDSESAEP